jgi:hypothetical protein
VRLPLRYVIPDSATPHLLSFSTPE